MASGMRVVSLWHELCKSPGKGAALGHVDEKQNSEGATLTSAFLRCSVVVGCGVAARAQTTPLNKISECDYTTFLLNFCFFSSHLQGDWLKILALESNLYIAALHLKSVSEHTKAVLERGWLGPARFKF